ncbi:hypothetical protein HYFRA_00007219 [Hymenoscyphus fraxineus]|uniref:Secreted protein n=1 Tax=Hymenoscyphus fraxineus TaxID=746836 RepID=A0A9N9KYP8_9HELO|nr:hypothetical protein HYFRA_00007219 [Hymenoscyphus fraxineus]
MLFAIFLLGLLNLLTITSSTPAVLSQEKRSKSTIICCRDTNQPWWYGDDPAIQKGIDTLKDRPGSCAVAAGPRVCTDLTCDDKHKIQLCNDNTYAIEPTCSYLATYAEDIMEKCSEPGDPTIGTPSVSCGQQFDTDNYNVIIMKNIDGECTGR